MKHLFIILTFVLLQPGFAQEWQAQYDQVFDGADTKSAQVLKVR